MTKREAVLNSIIYLQFVVMIGLLILLFVK